MAQFISDVTKKRTTVIVPGRTERPISGELPKTHDVCPFCPGNEHITPPEVFRIGRGEKDTEGWEVRVVPNLFPITDTHEVVIHSPSHTDDFDILSVDHTTKILQSYQERIRALREKGTVFVFCNRNIQGGASLAHPHSQITVIPKDISLEMHSPEPVANVIKHNESFVSYCPAYSEWPFELWIRPASKGTAFRDLKENEVKLLAEHLKSGIARLVAVFNDSTYNSYHTGVTFGYNFYFYDMEEWFIRIIPRFIHRAGFELGTGLSVNIVDPAYAAETLKRW